MSCPRCGVVQIIKRQKCALPALICLSASWLETQKPLIKSNVMINAPKLLKMNQRNLKFSLPLLVCFVESISEKLRNFFLLNVFCLRMINHMLRVISTNWHVVFSKEVFTLLALSSFLHALQFLFYSAIKCGICSNYIKLYYHTLCTCNLMGVMQGI